MKPVTVTFFGLKAHEVFLDEHYENFNHVISIYYVPARGEKVLLPLVSEDGGPIGMNKGSNWTKFNFRSLSGDIDQGQLTEGLRDFTAYWCYKNGIGLDNARFIVKVKKFETPKRWEEDFLKTQITNPWLEAGSFEWKNETISFNLNEIEKM